MSAGRGGDWGWGRGGLGLAWVVLVPADPGSNPTPEAELSETLAAASEVKGFC